MKKIVLIGFLPMLLCLAGCAKTSPTATSTSPTKAETIRAVSGSGIAAGKFDTVDFNLSASAVHTDKEKARQTVQATMADLTIALAGLSTVGVVFEDADTATTLRVTKEWDWKNNERVFRGFKVSTGMYLRTKNVDKTTDIVNMFSAVKNLEMRSPTFLLSDSQVDKLHRSAFKSAVKRAKARFSNECETLGLESTSFKVSSWNVRYDSSQNAWDEENSGAARLSASMRVAPRVTIQGGKPKIFVTVRLQYTK